MHCTRLGRIVVLSLVNASVAFTMVHAQEPAPKIKPEPSKGFVVRGCLTGSKLTHIDPESPEPALPDMLRVTSIRVIRSQVKALNGHEVEVIGTLRGIPDQESGVLVAGSDKGKVYIGGGDKNLGQDLTTSRNEPPTIHASTIKDVAPICAAAPKK